MSKHRGLAVGLWLLAALGACALATHWAGDGLRGKLQPWALVAVFWGAALMSVAIHHLSRYLSGCLDDAEEAVRRYRVRLEPAARLLARRVTSRAARKLALGEYAVRRLWRRHAPAFDLGARDVVGRFALVPDALGFSRLPYKGAILYVRDLSDRLVHVPRHNRGRHKAAAG
jgi:hypothetical protein